MTEPAGLADSAGSSGRRAPGGAPRVLVRDEITTMTTSGIIPGADGGTPLGHQLMKSSAVAHCFAHPVFTAGRQRTHWTEYRLSRRRRFKVAATCQRAQLAIFL